MNWIASQQHTARERCALFADFSYCSMLMCNRWEEGIWSIPRQHFSVSVLFQIGFTYFAVYLNRIGLAKIVTVLTHIYNLRCRRVHSPRLHFHPPSHIYIYFSTSVISYRVKFGKIQFSATCWSAFSSPSPLAVQQPIAWDVHRLST